MEVDIGVHNFKLNDTTDLPNANYKYSIATIFKRSNTDIQVILWGLTINSANYPPITNYYNSGSWMGWYTLATTADLANYLPLSGGQIDTTLGVPLGLNTTKDYALIEFKKNDTRTGCIGVSDNKPTFLDANGNWRDMLHSGNVGTYALPISGGTIKGTNATPLEVNNTDSTSSTSLTKFATAKEGTMGSLGFAGANNPVCALPNGGVKKLLHEGNSAKVLVQSTPLTAEGSIRVW